MKGSATISDVVTQSAVRGHAVGISQRNVCLSVSQPNVSLLLDKDTCTTQTVIRSGRAWTAVSLLVVNICPAVIESTAPCPRDYACYVNLQKLATNFPPTATSFTIENRIRMSTSEL